MRRHILLLVFMLIISSLNIAMANGGYDITNKDYSEAYKNGYTVPKTPDSDSSHPKKNYMYGDYNFPVAGVTEYGQIFLDISKKGFINHKTTNEIKINSKLNINPCKLK